MCINSRTVTTSISAPWGSVVLTAHNNLLWQVNFSLEPVKSNFPHPQALCAWAELIEHTLQTSEPLSEVVVEEIFSLPRMNTISAFNQRVLRELTKIPPGHFKTYQQVATTLGNPKASRAVARALASNPFVILLPCQRIVSKSSLTQFNMATPSSLAPKAFAGRSDFVEIGTWLRINDLANAV